MPVGPAFGAPRGVLAHYRGDDKEVGRWRSQKTSPKIWRSSTTRRCKQPFHVEQHGIDFIPESERWASPERRLRHVGGSERPDRVLHLRRHPHDLRADLRPGSVVIIVLGNLSFFLLGLCSLQGPNTGTTVFAINRAPFGPNGSRPISFFNWVTQIGFEVEGLILIVGAGLVLTIKAGFLPGDPAKVVLVIVGGADSGHPAVLRPRDDREDATGPGPALRRALRHPARLLHRACPPERGQGERRLAELHRGLGLHHRARAGSGGPRSGTTTRGTARRTRRRRPLSAGSSWARRCPRS